jgi:hypothetical protein
LYKVYGPDAELNLPEQLTAQRRAELDAMSLEELEKSYRAAGKAKKRSRYRATTAL